MVRTGAAHQPRALARSIGESHSNVEERFARIEREYAARERLANYGLRPRKTILLYGPHGYGKSLGAKRLAWNTGLSLMKVRFDALLSSSFGESAVNLRAVFQAAKERLILLLLDECDFIVRSRTTSKDIGEAAAFDVICYPGGRHGIMAGSRAFAPGVVRGPGREGGAGCRQDRCTEWPQDRGGRPPPQGD